MKDRLTADRVALWGNKLASGYRPPDANGAQALQTSVSGALSMALALLLGDLRRS
jgi:hypothetical protein